MFNPCIKASALEGARHWHGRILPMERHGNLEGPDVLAAAGKHHPQQIVADTVGPQWAPNPFCQFVRLVEPIHVKCCEASQGKFVVLSMRDRHDD